MWFTRPAHPTGAESSVRDFLTEIAREALLATRAPGSFFVESVSAGRGALITATIVAGSEPDPDYEDDGEGGDLAWLDQLAARVAVEAAQRSGLELRSWTTEGATDAEVRITVVFATA